MGGKERVGGKEYWGELKMEVVRVGVEEEGSIGGVGGKDEVNDKVVFKWIRVWEGEGGVCGGGKK